MGFELLNPNVYVETLSREEQAKYRREVKSEERRAVVWLGILAIVVAFDVWLRNGDTPQVFNAKFYNFFCNSPCSHITLNWVPFLDFLIYFWIGYAVCALVYFSEDLLPGKRATKIRQIFRRLGHILLAFYPVSVGVYLVIGINSVNLPDYLQTPSTLAISYIFGWFVLWTFETITGKKIFGERSILRMPIETLLDLAREGAQNIFETLVRAWRGILAKLGHPTTGPIRTKRAMLLLLSAIELVVMPIAYFVEHLSLSGLSYAFGAPLYALLIASATIGWFKKRKRMLENKKTEAS